MVLDSPDRRSRIIDMLWDLAFRRIEGGDNSQGEWVPADQVWELFKEQLADLGLELTVVEVAGQAKVPDPLRLVEEHAAKG